MKDNNKVVERAEQLEIELVLAQFSSLKNQVNPHFLFNNLSVLSSLVRIDPALSEKFIEHLSRTYRYILEQTDRDWVTLRNELNFIISYSFLLKIRFSEKFDLRIQIPEEELDRCKLAPLTLQILMENAVKHNCMSRQHPLIVEIIKVGDTLEIRNKLQPRTVSGPLSGGGLQNLINRYANLTDQLLWAGETENYFVVKIPIIF